jgi:hypothetical protein
VVLQVRTLTQEVAQLKAAATKANADGLAEKLQDLAQKTEDRQTRAETAIYQVGVRCCVLKRLCAAVIAAPAHPAAISRHIQDGCAPLAAVVHKLNAKVPVPAESVCHTAVSFLLCLLMHAGGSPGGCAGCAPEG